ncbi:MAG TPA: hypothetical protein VII95_18050, partial [Terriglobales bacterium]
MSALPLPGPQIVVAHFPFHPARVDPIAARGDALLEDLQQNRHSLATTKPAVKQSAAMPGVQRGVFALFGPLKFHSVSLCGRLYPLPRSTTFHFRNALHLIEARNSVAYVRSIFQRLL